MANIFNQVLFHWLDVNGRPATQFLCTLDQTAGGAGAYSALATAFESCTYAGLVAIQYQTTLLLNTPPATGPYQSVLDRAALLSRISTTNAPRNTNIVAPRQEIFLANHEVVDLTNPDVIALQNALTAVIGDTSGNPIGPIIRGTRQVARGS